MIDKNEQLVGYKYLFLGDDRQEKASIWLVKEHQGLEFQKGLLRLNKALRSEASKVEEVEKDYESKIALRYFEYTQRSARGEKISEESSSQQNVLIDEELSINQRLQPSSSSSSSASSASSSSESPEEAHLRRFREAFSRYTTANAKGFFEETLALYLKNDKSRLRINYEGWFAHLNCGLPSSANFHLYYLAKQDRP